MKGIDVPYTTVNGILATDRVYDIGFIKDVAQLCPSNLQQPQLDDPYSD